VSTLTGVDWAQEFYSQTGRWWGAAESGIGERDTRRVRLLQQLCGDRPHRVLDLGCSYGSTAAAMAGAGHAVTGVELSDRVGFAAGFTGQSYPGSLRIVRDDFYTVALGERFDVVCYWNGFGIGTDADQRRLLRRISTEWLAPGGRALIDVMNPLVWASWDGQADHKPARPADGYQHSLTQRLAYDPVHSRYTDTWQETGQVSAVSQHGRCYSPADLRLLLEGTGLTLTSLVVGEEILEPDASHPGHPALLRTAWEYLAVLS
jgi:SAM-dependent methyltransferase